MKNQLKEICQFWLERGFTFFLIGGTLAWFFAIINYKTENPDDYINLFAAFIIYPWFAWLAGRTYPRK
jgi:hypothetical protein